MKKVFLFLSIFFVVVKLPAQTNVSGSISSNTTWTKGGSPYVLKDDLKITGGAILTIEPGVIIRSDGRYQIRVKSKNSSILAIGSEADSITFEVPEHVHPFIDFFEADISKSSFSYIKAIGQASKSHESRFINTAIVPSNEEVVLQISNSLISNTAIGIGQKGGEIHIVDSKVLNSFMWTGVNGNGFLFKNDSFVNSNISIDFSSYKLFNTLGVVKVDNCQFINSPIYAPRSYLTIQNSKLLADNRNLKATPGSGIGSLIVVSGIDMANCSIDAGGNHGVSTSTGANINSINRIVNSAFNHCGRAITASEYESFTVEKNDFFEMSQRTFILNDDAKDLEANQNFFNEIEKLDELEKFLLHQPDIPNRGLIKVNGISSTPITTDQVLIPPRTAKSRKHEDDEFLDKIILDWQDGLYRNYETVLVYQLLSEADYSLKLVGEFDPESNPELNFSENVEFVTQGKMLSGELSGIAKALNSGPKIYGPYNPHSTEYAEELRYGLKVVALENDLVKPEPINMLWTSPALLKQENVSLEKIGASGDTLLYDLVLKPEPEEDGRISIDITFSNGLSTDISRFTLNIIQKPVLRGVDVVTGYYEGFPIDVNEPALDKFVNSTGQEEDPERIRITEVLNGTLVFKGDTVTSTEYIMGYEGSKEILWYPPPGTGIVDAFKIKVYDQDSESDAELVLQFDLLANTAPTIIKIDTVGVDREDQVHYLPFDRFNKWVELADDEGHAAHFIVTEVLSGKLLERFEANPDELELPVSYSDEHQRFLLWLPPKDAHGVLPAFRIKATDGSKSSVEEYEVYFNVEEVNDPPSFAGIQVPSPMNASTEIQTLSITGISTGANDEKDNLNFSILSIKGEELIPQNQVEIAYQQGEETALLRYLPKSNAKNGTASFIVSLSDGHSTYEQEVSLTFLNDDENPVIEGPERQIAYLGYSFNLDYSIKHSSDYTESKVVTNAGWLQVDNRPRIGALTPKTRDSRKPVDGYLHEARTGFVNLMVMDRHGDLWFVTGRKIRKLSKDGVISTVAGSENSGYIDGVALEARFSGISGLAYDSEEDIIYVIDNGNEAIRRIDQDYNVSTLVRDQGSDFNSLGRAAVGEGGALFVADYHHSDRRILKFDRNGGFEVYAGENPQHNKFTGKKEEIDVSSISSMAVVNGNLFFGSRDRLRKIDQNGIVSQIDLGDAIIPNGYDVFVSPDGDNHILVFQSRPKKFVRVNIHSNEFEVIAGNGGEVFEPSVVEVDNHSIGWSLIHIFGVLRLPNDHFIFSISSDDEGSYFASMRPFTDSIQGVPDETGTFEIEVEARDFSGNKAKKKVILEVLPNNQIQATNLKQDITFEEDSGPVDLENIVLSGLESEEEAKVTLTLERPFRGSFTTDSGNGETFVDSTGVWSITASQEDVNAALAKVRFEPIPNYDISLKVDIDVVRAVGGVPNKGEIILTANPIEDAPTLSRELKEEAYVDVPYDFVMSTYDADSYHHSFEINKVPSWLTFEAGDYWSNIYIGRPFSFSYEDGPISKVRLNNPSVIETDNLGNLYTVENGRVRKTTPGEDISTLFVTQNGFQDGSLSEAKFGGVTALAFDENGGMFVADFQNRRIRLVSGDQVTTVAGNGLNGLVDGKALKSSFSEIRALAYDSNSKSLYIADNNRIRRFSPNGNVKTIAGNGGYGAEEGKALEIPFYSINDLEFNNDGDLVILDDRTIRVLTLNNNNVKIVTGTNQTPRGIADMEVADDGSILAVDDDFIYQIDPANGKITYLNTRQYSGYQVGPLKEIYLNYPSGITKWGNVFYVIDSRENTMLRLYKRFGSLKGTPTQTDVGRHEVNYTITDHQQNTVEHTGFIEVFENDKPDFKGIDSTYVYTEDASFLFDGFRLLGDEDKEYKVSLQLENLEKGKLEIPGVQDVLIAPGHLELTGTGPEINAFLSSIRFVPNEHEHVPNQVRIIASMEGGKFERKGVLYLKGDPVNDVPEIESISDIELVEGQQVEVRVRTTDADGHPVEVYSNDLPPGLKLERRIKSYVTFEAGGSNGALLEGPRDDVRLSNPANLGFDEQGRVHFTAQNYFRYLTEDSIKLYGSKDHVSFGGTTDLVFEADSAIFFSFYSVYAYNPDGTLKRVLGESYGDVDGTAQDARFAGIEAAVRVGPGLYYVVDYWAEKLKQINNDLSVKTVAVADGSSSPKPIDVSTDGRGNVFVLDAVATGIKKVNNSGEIENVTYSINSTLRNGVFNEAVQLETDIFGNHFLSNKSEVWLLDTDGLVTKVAGTQGKAIEEGEGLEINLGRINDWALNSFGELYYGQQNFGIINKLAYQFEYYIVGTVPSGSSGNYSSTLEADDGWEQGRVSTNINFEIIATDKPTIEGLDQSFTYEEDADRVVIDPIKIIENDSDKEFIVTITLDDVQTGELKSDVEDLDQLLINGAYQLEGNVGHINNILSQLQFVPASNNVEPSLIELSFRAKTGMVSESGSIDLKVSAVNDPPSIVALTVDTVAIVDELMRIGFNLSDAEGSVSLKQSEGIPDWLSLTWSNYYDELFAGVPGKPGQKNDTRLSSSFDHPISIDIDARNRLYVLESGKNGVRRIDENGNVKVFSGNGIAGFKDGDPGAAQFNNPIDLAIDESGGIYVSDSKNFAVRKIDFSGRVTTIAGNGEPGYVNGIGAEARFGELGQIAIDQENQLLFVLDKGNSVIREIDLLSGRVSSLALSDGYYDRLIKKASGLSFDKHKRLLHVIIPYALLQIDLKTSFVEILGNSSSYGSNGDGSLHLSELNTTRVISDRFGRIFMNDFEGRPLRSILNSRVFTLLGYNNTGFELGFLPEIKYGFISDMLVLSDHTILALDKTNHVIRKLSLRQPALMGTPQLEDVGTYEINLEVEDKAGLVASQKIKVEVKNDQRLQVNGLGAAVIFKENQEKVKFPAVEINSEDSENIELFMQPGTRNGSVGSGMDQLVPFNEELQGWYVNATVDSINRLLNSSYYFPEINQREDFLLELSFKKKGTEFAKEGLLSFIVSKENQAPTFNSSKVFEVLANKDFDISLKSHDVDGDSVSYRLINGPSWMVGDSTIYVQEYFNPLFSPNMNDSLKNLLGLDIADMILNSTGDIVISNHRMSRLEELSTSHRQIKVLAGSGIRGYSDGDALSARFNEPVGLQYDSNDELLIVESLNRRIRRLTKEGQVTTVSGSGEERFGNGIGSHVAYLSPQSMVITEEGEVLVIDSKGNAIRKVAQNSLVSTYLGNPASTESVDGTLETARTLSPRHILIGSDGLVYFSESTKLRVVENGQVRTLNQGEQGFQDGPLSTSKFGSISHFIEMEPGVFLVADELNQAIRKVDLNKNVVSTLAGTRSRGDQIGEASLSTFDAPNRLLKLNNGNILVFDSNNSKLKQILYSSPRLTGKTGIENIGDHKVQIELADGRGGVLREEIIIRVLPPNDEPTVKEIDDVELVYSDDGTYSINLFDYFDDLESADSELTYEVVSNSGESVATSESINSSDGELVLKIQNAGSADIEVKATDPRGQSVSTSFTLTVTKAIVEIVFGETEFLNDGQAKEVTVTTDPQDLEYTITYNGSQDTPTGIGEYEVIVTIDERNYSGQATTILSIVNRAPEDINIDTNTIFENKQEGTAIGTLSVTDQNSVDTHVYTLTANKGDNALFSIEGADLVSAASFDFEEQSSYTVIVNVEDNHGANFEKEVTVNVLDVNDAPSVNEYGEIAIVKDLGALEIQLDGIGAGDETNQQITISANASGVVADVQINFDSDPSKANIIFSTRTGQEGEGSIVVTVKDNGGTENGGVDQKVITIPVSVLPANVEAADVSNCGPGEVTLSASGAGAYRWYESPLSGDVLAEGESFVTSLTQSAEYFVAGIFDGKESKLRVPVDATILETPEKPVITNDNSALSVPLISGLSYQWFNNGQAVSGQTSHEFSPTESGNYSVQVTNEVGCSVFSDEVELSITGIDNGLIQVDVKMYPVPANSTVQLEFAQPFKIGTIVILRDNNGKELSRTTLNKVTSTMTIDVSELPSGIHIISVQDGIYFVRKRLIVQH